MNTFFEIIFILLLSAVTWHIMLIFVTSDSRYQMYRFRKALDRIYYYVESGTGSGLNLIYKNKKFSVNIIREEINYCYAVYHILINDEEAGCLHQLKHMWISSYYYEAVNKRHRDEVTAVIYATNKLIKRMEKPKQVKQDGWTEYSYFN